LDVQALLYKIIRSVKFWKAVKWLTSAHMSKFVKLLQFYYSTILNSIKCSLYSGCWGICRMWGCSQKFSPIYRGYEEKGYWRHGPCNGRSLVILVGYHCRWISFLETLSFFPFAFFVLKLCSASLCRRCVGYYSEADAPGRRLAKPLIFCQSESDCPMENGYARPVEGIYVLVDMQNMVVIEFEDRKLVPLPPVDPLRNYTPGETRGGSDRSDVKPLQIIQPEGPSFRVNGYFVEWQKVDVRLLLLICHWKCQKSWFIETIIWNFIYITCICSSSVNSGIFVLDSHPKKVWLYILLHMLMVVMGEGLLLIGWVLWRWLFPMEIRTTHIIGKMLLMLGKMAWEKMHIPSRRFLEYHISPLVCSNMTLYSQGMDSL